VRWNPESIVSLARQAGMRFIVITTKHHDGFSLFQTKFTKYNAVDGTPYGRDIVKGLADACARNGVKFGVYYSSIDWHHPDATPWTDDNNNEIPPKHADLNVGQLRELLTGYGPLSEIWFDMGKPTPAQSKRFADTVHSLQPACMVSGRVFNHQGDFTVMPDNRIPDFIIDEPWQTPASIYHETWGYRSWQPRTDLRGKIDEHIVKLVEVVSRGGNYLLNIGPRGDGSVVELEADVLRGAGTWLKTNGEAIYGTRPQPFRNLEFGYATVKPGRLYLMVRSWPADGVLRLPGLKTPIRSAYLLADARKTPLAIKGETVRVDKPRETPPVTVVVAELEGELHVAPPVIRPDQRGVVTLRAANAETFYNYNGRGYYDPPTIYKLHWDFVIARGGKYRVELVTKAGEKDGRVELDVDGQSHVLAGDRSMATEVRAKEYLGLTLTPPRPFAKGEKLGITVDQVVLTPLPY
jgi:alpha-L-fucosidase